MKRKIRLELEINPASYEMCGVGVRGCDCLCGINSRCMIEELGENRAPNLECNDAGDPIRPQWCKDLEVEGGKE